MAADRTTLRADGQDLSFVTVEAADAEGRLQPNADQEIHFALSGPGSIAAVGNADGRDLAPYQGDRRKLFGGRAQVVVRTSRQAGAMRLTAAGPEMRGSVLTLRSAGGGGAEL